MITEDQKALALIAASLMSHEELDYKQAIGRAMTLVEEAEAQLHDKAEENRWASTSGILPPRRSGGRQMIDWKKTERGFAVGSFRDCYGDAASVQQSSSAEDDRMWLGLDHGVHVEGKCLARMHLNREQARELAAVLLRFADTGIVWPSDEAEAAR